MKTVTSARLFFPDGTTKNLQLEEKVDDLEEFRQKLKEEHGALVVRLQWEIIE